MEDPFGISGMLQYILGFAYGLQYTEHKSGKCYTAIESDILNIDTMLSLLGNAYLPENWADILLTSQDLVDLQAAIFANCNI